ncbi:MAG: hypothetical protein ACI9LX_004747, partial [Paraglaciecola sp.]
EQQKIKYSEFKFFFNKLISMESEGTRGVKVNQSNK